MRQQQKCWMWQDVPNVTIVAGMEVLPENFHAADGKVLSRTDVNAFVEAVHLQQKTKIAFLVWPFWWCSLLTWEMCQFASGYSEKSRRWPIDFNQTFLETETTVVVCWSARAPKTARLLCHPFVPLCCVHNFARCNRTRQRPHYLVVVWSWNFRTRQRPPRTGQWPVVMWS